jgi:hypothetical protein
MLKKQKNKKTKNKRKTRDIKIRKKMRIIVGKIGARQGKYKLKWGEND